MRSARSRTNRVAIPTPGPARSESGSAVVDFVLVVLVLVPLVLGVLQVGLTLFVRNTLAAAASEGARYAAMSGHSPHDGEVMARSQIQSVLAARFAESVVADRVLVAGSPGVRVSVHARVPVLGLGGPALELDMAGHAVAEDP